MNYWDRIAEMKQDNIWKRAAIVERLLPLGLMGTSVLEIGVGLGTAAGALDTIFCGNWDYMGTDVSQKNCDFASHLFGLDIKRADIVDLPFSDNSFDTVIALDTLEHVEKKGEGYHEINRALRPSGRVVLNIPVGVSCHDEDKEFGFTMDDLFNLLKICGMGLEQYETYAAKKNGDILTQHEWAVGVR